MKKMKRFLAVLLAMSLVLGSTNCSVFASSGAELITESDDTGTEDAASESAGTGESVTENADTEEAAENSDTEESMAESGDEAEVDTEKGAEDASETEEDSETLTEELDESVDAVDASVLKIITDLCSVTYINPLYEDVIEESDLLQPSGSSDAGTAATSSTVEYLSSISEAADVIRDGMESRDVTITFGYTTDTYDSETFGSTVMAEILEEALEHTGVSTQGDYLRWQYAGWIANMVSGYYLSGHYYFTLTYTITYYTTAAQEAELTAALEEVEASLGLDSLSNYEKVLAIYEYIFTHVTYDYDNLYDGTYTLKYTAYAALMNGTSVCQGYALLFYRMALDAGLDARFISGTANGGAHGWNIVKLGGSYYNLDVTWESSYYETYTEYYLEHGYEDYVYEDYFFFLLCDANFTDHTRDNGYSTDEFYAAYPMGTEDYDPETMDDTYDTGVVEVSSADEFWAAVEDGATDISIVNDFTLEGDAYLNDEDYGPANITVESGVTLTIQDGCLYMSGVLTVDGDIYLSNSGLYVVGYTGGISGQGTISGDEESSVTVADTYLNWAEQSYNTLHTISIDDAVTINVPIYKYLYTTVEKFSQTTDYTGYEWVGICVLPDQESTVVTIDQAITVPSISIPYFSSALYYTDDNGDAYFSDATVEIVVADGGSLTLEGYVGLGGVQITVQDGGSLTVNDGLYISHSSAPHEGYLCVEESGTLTVNGYLYLEDNGETFDGALLDVAGTLTGSGEIYAYGTNLQQVTGDASSFTGTMDGDLWVNNRLMLAWLDWDNDTWTVSEGYDSGIWISPVDMYCIQFYVMSYGASNGWSMVQVDADELTATDRAVQVTDTTDSLGTYSEITVSSLGEYSLYYANGGSKYLGVSVTCELPDIGYYTSSTASEDSLVDGGYVDGTVYYVILSNGVSLTDGSELTVNYLYDYDENEEVTDSWSDYISLKQVSDTVWMLTITGASSNFNLSISAEVENEYGDSWTTERGINFSNWISVSTYDELVAALATGSNINVDFDMTLTEDLTISGERYVNLNGNVTVPDGVTLTIESTGDGTGGVYVCLSNEITLTVENGGTLVIDGYLGENGGYEEDDILYDGATINVEKGGTLTVNGELYMWWSGVEVEDGPTSMLYVSGTMEGSGTIYVYVDGSYVSSAGEVTGTNHFTGTVDDGANLLKLVDKVVVDYVSWDDDNNAYMQEDYGSSMYIRPIYDLHQVNFYRTVYNNGVWSYELIDFADLSWDDGLTVSEETTGENGLSAVAVSLSDVGEYNVYYTDEDGYQHAYTVYGSLWNVDIYSGTTASVETMVGNDALSTGDLYYLVARDDYILVNASVTEGSEYVTLTATDDQNVWEVAVNEEYCGTDFNITIEVELYNADDESQSTWTESYGFGFSCWVDVDTFEEFAAAAAAGLNINVTSDIDVTENVTIAADTYVNFNANVTVKSGATLMIYADDKDNDEWGAGLGDGYNLTVESGGTLVIGEGAYMGVGSGYVETDSNGNVTNRVEGARIQVEEGGILCIDGTLQMGWSCIEDYEDEDGNEAPTSILYVAGTLEGSGIIHVYIDGSYISYAGEVNGTNHFTGTMNDGSALIKMVDAMIVDWVEWDDDGNAYMPGNYDTKMYLRPIDILTVNLYRTVYSDGEWSYEQIDFADLSWDDGLTVSEESVGQNGLGALFVGLSDLNEYSMYYTDEDGYQHSLSVYGSLWNFDIYSDAVASAETLVGDGVASEGPYYLIARDDYVLTSVNITEGSEYVTLTATDDANVWLLTVNEDYYDAGFYIVVEIELYNADDESTWTESYTFSFPHTESNGPVITVQPESVTITSGDKVTFSIEAESDSELSYQWYFMKSGATKWTTWYSRASFTVTSADSWDGMQIKCVVTDENGNSVESNVITVTFVTITITSQPQSVIINSGDKVTFSIEAEGDSELSYQWYFMKSGATKWTSWYSKASFTATSSDTWDGMQIKCVVTDLNGNSVESDVVTVTFNTKASDAITITSQPESVTITSGDKVSFSITAEGEGELTYQWYIMKSGATKWSAWYAKESFTATSNDTWDGMQIKCVVTDEAGNSVESDIVTVTLATNNSDAITITSQPESVTIISGDKVSFSITAEGESTLAYQWYIMKSGATKWSTWYAKESFTATSNDTWDGMQIKCVVTDEAGNSVESDTVTVTLTTNNSDAITITSQPESVTIVSGDKVSFSITAEGESTLTYQWYIMKSGATKWSTWYAKQSFTAASNDTWDGMQIKCVVTDEAGNSVESDIVTVTLTVDDNDSDAITITSQPESVTITSGDKVSFSITAEGNGLTYQWYFMKSGATKWTSWYAKESFTAASNDTWNGMQIKCVITDADGNSTESDIVTVTFE